MYQIKANLMLHSTQQTEIKYMRCKESYAVKTILRMKILVYLECPCPICILLVSVFSVSDIMTYY